MLSVKGHFKDGVVVPTEPVIDQGESEVIITSLNADTPKREVRETDYDALTKLIDEDSARIFL